jgi:hypothetical protein
MFVWVRPEAYPRAEHLKGSSVNYGCKKFYKIGLWLKTVGCQITDLRKNISKNISLLFRHYEKVSITHLEQRSFGVNLLGSGSIHVGINYSVLNEMKQYK